MRLSPSYIISLFRGEDRDSEAMRQIALSAIAKVISVASSLLIVPLTIHFLNETRYGIWLTLTSIIAWISYFDFGLGNGFRNKFAEAKANNDDTLARQYVSTTYFALSVIIFLIWIAAVVVNRYINWPNVLKIDGTYGDELRVVFFVVCSFFCVNMVVSIFTTLLTADQKSGVASLVQSAGQLGSLAAIWFLSKFAEGSLLNLALYFSGVPCLTILLVSIVAFTMTRYRAYRPRIADINTKLISGIISLGIVFFAIYLCLLVIFQMMNIVLSRVIGPDAVTLYNIPYKYFNILNIISLIVITPFWSAFTDAYTKKDYPWMAKICRKLELFWLFIVALGLALFAFSTWFYRIWVGESISIDKLLSLSVMLYVILQVIGNFYMYLINGTGKIWIQFMIYLVSAVCAWPLMNLCCKSFGVSGIVVIPAAVCMIQAIFGRIQLKKIMSGTATGWWNK